jgi:RNA polymerase sigma-70 factor (ECF subfamily)
VKVLAANHIGRSSRKKVFLVEPDVQKAKEAFARVVREHQKAVYAVALSKLGNAHDAEDVKQEVFIEAWRNMENLRNIEKISGWLYKATLNRCRDHFRKKSRRKRREEQFAETAAPPPRPSAEDRESIEAMSRAISMLPERIRTVVMLKHLAELSYAEISQMTGLSKTKIDGRLRAGKKKLRQMLIDMGIGVD